MTRHASTIECVVCGARKNRSEFAIGDSLHEAVVHELREEHPDWSVEQPVCFTCLNRFRAQHVRRLLQEEKRELSSLEEQVIHCLGEQQSVSVNVNEQFEQQLTLGERVSDQLASFGGSWNFLAIFAIAF